MSFLFRCIYERKVLGPREIRAGKFVTSLIYNPGTKPIFDALRPVAENLSISDTFSLDIDKTLGKAKATELGKELKRMISQHSEYQERISKIDEELAALAKSMLALAVPRIRVVELIGDVFYPTCTPPKKVSDIVMKVFKTGKFYLPLGKRDTKVERVYEEPTSTTELLKRF